MSYVVKCAKNDEFVLKIVQDDDVTSPRQDFDNLGTMICFHRRYNLGDPHSYSDPRHFLESLASELSDFDDEQLEVMSMGDLLEVIEEYAVILPLYLYDHSGITISTTPFSCKWDSGQVGWIYVTYEKMATEGLNIEKAVRSLEAEVETYDQYLTGDVYGFKIETRDGDLLESCWGFYGLDYLISELKGYLPNEYHDLVDSLTDVNL